MEHSNVNKPLNSPFIDDWKVTSMGFQQLAIQFSPALQPASASKMLLNWILIHPELKGKLTEAGWFRGARRLTPVQVALIVEYLGIP